jgi:hypothetical protein
MPTGGVLIAILAISGVVYGGSALVQVTNHHVIQPVKHAIVHVLKKI